MFGRNRPVSLASRAASARGLFVGLLATLSLLGGALPAAAQRLPSDDSHSAFQKRRQITVADPSTAAPGSTFGAVALPPEINSGGEPSFRDLRLVRVATAGSGSGAGSGAVSEGPSEIAYLVEEQRDAVAAVQYRGTLLDTRSEYHPFTDHNVWLIDFGRGAAWDRVDLDIPERDFARRFKFEVADHKGGPYRLLQDDVGVFDKIWVRDSPHRIHHTHLTLDRVIRSRFLRITSDPVRFPPHVTVTGVTASRREAVPGTIWTRPAPAEALPIEPVKKPRGAPSFTRYRLQLPAGLPIEQVTIAADDPAFARLVRLVEERPGKQIEGQSSGGTTAILGEGVLFRVAGTPKKNRPLAPESEVTGESLSLTLSAHPELGALFVEIDASQGPPLSNLRFTVSGVGARLLFPLLPGDREFVLYYAAPTVRPPLYDLEALRNQVTQLEVRRGVLAAEQANPAYRVVPPLSFVRTAGAPVDVSLFRLQRPLTLSGDGKPDIYAATLAAEDLAVLGSSYGDLRIVDPEEHQIPYVLERYGSEGRLPLNQSEAPRGGGDMPRGPTATTLHLSYSASGSTLALPYEALELEITDVFYTRTARLFALPPAGTGAVQPQGGERLLWSGTLSRKPEGADAGEPAEAEPNRGTVGRHLQRLPFTLPADLPRAARLRLEIENGDNSPLNVSRALGVLTLPRLAAKLDGSTAYRLLLSAPSVEAPRYDIETLRRELFDYAAVRAGFGALSANPQYRARAADFLQDPSSTSATAVLWGVLLLAMLSLVGLTVRLLRRPPENPA